jgi:tRNA threonylcarbamoyl adenosine modification protein YeaZ/ribosomal-protein-alanine acetyltransferase
VVILALETATRRGSVALFDRGTVHASHGDPARTHGQRLPSELLDWLSTHDRSLGDVDLLAVIAGPGSFTGLRVGMATIQGLALATSKEVVAVPTLEAMAFAWNEREPAPARPIAPCLDGQRGDVFFAAYDPAAIAALDFSNPILRPQVGRPEDAADKLRGAAGGPPVVVGDGAMRYADRFAALLPEATMSALPVPLAEPAARIASLRPGLAAAPHALRPLYIRRPDAELARERVQGRSAPQPPPGFVVTRAFGPDDLTAVEALQRRSFTNPWGAEAIRWELENTDVARLYVMRGPDGEVAAYCACWLIFDELHINSLAVAEPLRRRRLADTLLRQVMREAVASGARSATLEVRRSNDPALALYERLGFRVEAVRRDYYQGPREDALVLWNRRLDELA